MGHDSFFPLTSTPHSIIQLSSSHLIDTASINNLRTRREIRVFSAMKIHVLVFWDVTACSDVVGYKSFGWPCCLRLQKKDGGRPEENDLDLKTSTPWLRVC